MLEIFHMTMDFQVLVPIFQKNVKSRGAIMVSRDFEDLNL